MPALSRPILHVFDVRCNNVGNRAALLRGRQSSKTTSDPSILGVAFRSIVPGTDAIKERKARFDLKNLQDSKIGLPLVEPVQRIVIRTQILWLSTSPNSMVEHSTQRLSIDDAGPNPKTDNSPCELIHHDKNPMGSQSNGLASKEIPRSTDYPSHDR